MKRQHTVLLFLGFSGMVMCMGCGGDEDTNTAPTQWAGADLHIRIVGNLRGETIDVDVKTPDANNTANVWCEREYQVPNNASGMPDYTKGHNSEIRFKTPTTIAGENRLIDIGIKRHNMQADKAGTVINIIPRVDAQPPCSLNNCPTGSPAWFSFTWRNPTDNSILYKAAAVSGNFTVGEFIGTPDSTGLLIPPNTGMIGGFGTGQWSPTETLSVSVTAQCTINKIDNSY